MKGDVKCLLFVFFNQQVKRDEVGAPAALAQYSRVSIYYRLVLAFKDSRHYSRQPSLKYALMATI